MAHELGHNFDLNHNTFGAGPNPNGVCDSACRANLMTAGDNRALSTAATVLTNLKNGTADQLNALQAEQVVDPTGFLNPIPLVSSRISPQYGEAPSGKFHVSLIYLAVPVNF